MGQSPKKNDKGGVDWWRVTVCAETASWRSGTSIGKYSSWYVSTVARQKFNTMIFERLRERHGNHPVVFSLNYIKPRKNHYLCLMFYEKWELCQVRSLEDKSCSSLFGSDPSESITWYSLGASWRFYCFILTFQVLWRRQGDLWVLWQPFQQQLRAGKGENGWERIHDNDMKWWMCLLEIPMSCMFRPHPNAWIAWTAGFYIQPHWPTSA